MSAIYHKAVAWIAIASLQCWQVPRRLLHSPAQMQGAVLALSLLFVTDVVAETPARHVSAKSSSVDLTRKPVPRLQSGIVIGKEQDSGYSNLVMLVLPRLSTGDVGSLPEYAKRYARMFKFTALANVRSRQVKGRTDYLLDKFGVGWAIDIDGEFVVVTSAIANQYGANLDTIDRGVLLGNERCLDDIIQVARSSRMIIFDAKTNILIDSSHQEQILRYFVWASPASGNLGILVWLLKDKGTDEYEIASTAMQLLPSGYHEDRQIHVSKGGFLSNIPTSDRFAMVQIPEGTTVPFSAKMRSVAGRKSMTSADLQQVMAGASESLSQITSK